MQILYFLAYNIFYIFRKYFIKIWKYIYNIYNIILIRFLIDIILIKKMNLYINDFRKKY